MARKRLRRQIFIISGGPERGLFLFGRHYFIFIVIRRRGREHFSCANYVNSSNLRTCAESRYVHRENRARRATPSWGKMSRGFLGIELRFVLSDLFDGVVRTSHVRGAREGGFRRFVRLYNIIL